MPSGIEESELGYRLEKELDVQVKYNEEIYCETQKVYDVDDFFGDKPYKGGVVTSCGGNTTTRRSFMAMPTRHRMKCSSSPCVWK